MKKLKDKSEDNKIREKNQVIKDLKRKLSETKLELSAKKSAMHIAQSDTGVLHRLKVCCFNSESVASGTVYPSGADIAHTGGSSRGFLHTECSKKTAVWARRKRSNHFILEFQVHNGQIKIWATRTWWIFVNIWKGLKYIQIYTPVSNICPTSPGQMYTNLYICKYL